MTLARLRLARTDNVGPLTWRRLLQRHGSAESALDALPRIAARRGGAFAIPEPATIAREMDAVAAMGGRFLFLGDPDYPPLLALLHDAPMAIAVIGDAARLHAPAVAIVGARNASAGGRRIAEDMAEELAAQGIAIVSGLARGIDTAAHRGALRKGVTIAVLPGGLDVAYPPDPAALQTAIAEQGGAVLAEPPLGTAPLARHFPKRNRIVAGLSLGVVVIEAAERSGTLITARLALESGREIFAVPGSPLDPRARGSNDLIRQGAHLAETAADILQNLPEAPREAPLFAPRPGVPEAADAAPDTPDLLPGANGDASQIFDLIGNTPISVDEVLRRCHLSAPGLQAILTDLELEGRVELLPGNRVLRAAKD